MSCGSSCDTGDGADRTEGGSGYGDDDEYLPVGRLWPSNDDDEDDDDDDDDEGSVVEEEEWCFLVSVIAMMKMVIVTVAL